jgi:hypothetical protein
MKNIRLVSLAGLASCIASSTLFAATQHIVSSPSNFNASAEEVVELSLLYSEGSPETTGVGVQIFFDSTKLEFVDTNDLLESTFTHISPVFADDTDLDSSDETDSKVVTSFGVPSGIFIASEDMPSSLLTVTFKAKDSFDSATVINFTGVAAAGHEVAFTPVAISYKDNVAPVVTAPESLTVEATGETTAVDLGVATATDLVDGDLIATASNTGPFTVGTHTITWEASDSSGNAATAEQTVTVEDNVAPVVTAPEPLSLEATGDTTTVDLGTAIAIDVVDGDLVATANNTGPFAVGTHTITWTASDSSGNTATAEQTVTVNEAVVTTTKKSGGGSVPLFFLPLLLVFGLLGRKLDSATKGDLKDA